MFQSELTRHSIHVKLRFLLFSFRKQIKDTKLSHFGNLSPNYAKMKIHCQGR